MSALEELMNDWAKSGSLRVSAEEWRQTIRSPRPDLLDPRWIELRCRLHAGSWLSSYKLSTGEDINQFPASLTIVPGEPPRGYDVPAEQREAVGRIWFQGAIRSDDGVANMDATILGIVYLGTHNFDDLWGRVRANDLKPTIGIELRPFERLSSWTGVWNLEVHPKLNILDFSLAFSTAKPEPESTPDEPDIMTRILEAIERIEAHQRRGILERLF